MKRLTTDNPQNNLQTALNLFFVKDGQAWVRGGGEYPDYPDVTLDDYIVSAIKHCATSPELFDMLDDGVIGEVMADWAMEGNVSKEGLLGVLYQAGWAFAELRERLKKYEEAGLSPEETAILPEQYHLMDKCDEDQQKPLSPLETAPLCPWCTAVMAVKIRKSSKGVIAQYYCPMCRSKAPAVCMDDVAGETKDDLLDAARMVSNSWITGVENPTNGDKIRQLIATSDQQLAKVLQKLNDMGGLDDKIHFCRQKPECEEIVEKGDCVPSENCLQCLAHWLGQPADEKLWREINV